MIRLTHGLVDGHEGVMTRLLCLSCCSLLFACADAGPAEAEAASSTGEAMDASTGTASSSGEVDESSSESGDSSSGGTPGVCSTVAAEVTLRDVSVFQVLETRLFEDGAAVSVEERKVPLVAGRDGLVRARVELASARSLALQLEVETAGTTHTIIEPVEVGGDAMMLATIPASLLSVDAKLSVSVLDCAEGAAAGGARFPASGSVALDPVQTGPLAIHFVPFEIGGFVPDTSPEVLAGFEAAILSLYPVTEVVMTVGDVVPDAYGGQVDMGDLLVDTGIVQEMDDAPPHVYYYGLVTGAATREEFCSSCPTGSSESGNGNRAAFSIGAAFADARAQSTLTHELGHMHGLLHAPCGNPDLLDDAFPHAGAETTVEGYDWRTGTFIAPDAKDVMAYCDPRWVSDYHYAKMVEWVQRAQTWSRN
ncbi:MAG: M66 family metalloprotease [Myxococcota bacterium]